MKSQGTVNAGIIGLGLAGQAHAEALRRLPNVRLLAIVSRNPELAEQRAMSVGANRWYTDYRELIEDPDIDVVHVCTPNAFHFAASKATLENGKHVISEKPLADTVERAQKLAKIAREHADQISAVVFNYRAYPMVQYTRSVMRAHGLGDLLLVHGSYLQDWLLYATDYDWRVDPELGGQSRAMADIGSHWCDLVEYVTGERIQRLNATYRRVHDRRGDAIGDGKDGSQSRQKLVTNEDIAIISFEMESSAPGAVVVSQVSAGRKNRLTFELSCSDGSFGWDQERPDVLWRGSRNKANGLLMRDPAQLPAEVLESTVYPAGHPEGWPDAMAALFRRVYRDIGEGPSEHAWYATFDDGARATALVDAASRSQGRWIPTGDAVGKSQDVQGLTTQVQR